MSLKNNSWNTSFFGEGAGYGDNWDPTKNPISIGFIPGQALQSRELLELQTILAYQTSTTNRCLFRHGQPRVDLETESLTAVNTSPVTTTGNEPNAQLQVYKNAEFFCNFDTPATPSSWIPTGFWLTFPPYLDDTQDKLTLTIPSMSDNEYLGFQVDIRVVNGRGTEVDQFGNAYDFTDPALVGAIGAGRLVYEIVNQGDIGNPNPAFVSTNRNPELESPRDNTDGSKLYRGFVPIIRKLGENNFVYAFDDTTTVPST